MSAEVRDTDPIAEPRRRLCDAFMNGDVATVLSYYGDNAVLMAPNEPSLFGKKEIEEWHEEYFSVFRIATLEQTEREITMFDGWAVERWAYLVAIESLNSPDRIRDDGRFLTVWKNEGGAWRIQQVMFNSIRPIGSGTSRFLVRLKKKT